jgi:hypothetical protein
VNEENNHLYVVSSWKTKVIPDEKQGQLIRHEINKLEGIFDSYEKAYRCARKISPFLWEWNAPSEDGSVWCVIQRRLINSTELFEVVKGYTVKHNSFGKFRLEEIIEDDKDVETYKRLQLEFSE